MKEYNKTIAVDDTILVKDVPAGAGSKILEGFQPLFSAEAVTRLEGKGYEIGQKTQVGEFGLDLVGEFSYYSNAFRLHSSTNWSVMCNIARLYSSHK